MSELSELKVSPMIMPEGYENAEDRFAEEEKDVWVELYAARQNKTILEGLVSAVEEHNLRDEKMPCLVVRFGQVKGLIPLPHSGVEEAKMLYGLIGRAVNFKVIGLDRENNLVVLSRKEALEHMARVTWERLEAGKKHRAVVRKAGKFYAILDLGGVTAKLDREEASWGFVPDMRAFLRPGQRFNVLVTEVDKENQKLSVSLKRLHPCPWPDVATRYEAGKNEYLAVVTGVPDEAYGVFVNLEPGVDALCPHMRAVRLEPGDRVVVRIRKVDAEKQHIYAVIKRKLY